MLWSQNTDTLLVLFCLFVCLFVPVIYTLTSCPLYRKIKVGLLSFCHRTSDAVPLRGTDSLINYVSVSE